MRKGVSKLPVRRGIGLVKYLIFALALENFESILAEYAPITLKEMDGVALMNRTDTKYVFHLAQLLEILKRVKSDYRVLEIGGMRASRYKTLYFDTPDLDFYIKHQNGKKNRYKVRSRKYVDSDLCFLEVKFKNNKGRTVKTRVTVDDFELDLSQDSNDFISETAGQDFNLRPALWNSFKRITLVNQDLPERLTIDTELAFEIDGEHKTMKNLVIAELKQEKANRHSPFAKAVKELGIRPERISKYCLGVAMMKEDVKKNTFKKKIMKIEKLENESAA